MCRRSCLSVFAKYFIAAGLVSLYLSLPLHPTLVAMALVAFLLLVVRPGAPSSFLLLIAMASKLSANLHMFAPQDVPSSEPCYY